LGIREKKGGTNESESATKENRFIMYGRALNTFFSIRYKCGERL